MSEQSDRLEGLRIDRTSDQRRKTGRWPWIAAAILLALGAAATLRWTSRTAAIEVSTAVVRELSGSASQAVLEASGYVTARRQATVSSKITGKIVEVLVEEGMEVEEGQVLARLDDSLQRRSLLLSEAQLASARSSLEETRVRLHEAQLTLERTRRLVAEGFDSQASLDAAEAEVDSLRARLEVGRNEVAVAQRLVEVRIQELADTVIRAPFSGVAISKNAQPGEMISPMSAGGSFTRTGVGTIVDMSSLEIEVDVNESYINRVRPEQRVEAVLDAYPEWRIPARVITMVPTADRQKATVRVRIAFDELDPRILPDMGVRVSFIGFEEPAPPSSRRRLLMPRTALRQDAGQDVVFVIAGERVERRAVRVAPAGKDEIEVLAGLSSGEQVVVSGPENLADGDRVLVR